MDNEPINKPINETTFTTPFLKKSFLIRKLFAILNDNLTNFLKPH